MPLLPGGVPTVNNPGVWVCDMEHVKLHEIKYVTLHRLAAAGKYYGSKIDNLRHGQGRYEYPGDV